MATETHGAKTSPVFVDDFFVAYERDPAVLEVIVTEPPPLAPHDLASWAAFLPTVRVGGALPVSFRLDGSCVVVEMIAPYVAPTPPEPRADPHQEKATKIPLPIAQGFPVPISGRYRLPTFAPDNAAHFLRQIVRTIYQHEIDEQFCVGNVRPFDPEH